MKTLHVLGLATVGAVMGLAPFLIGSAGEMLAFAWPLFAVVPLWMAGRPFTLEQAWLYALVAGGIYVAVGVLTLVLCTGFGCILGFGMINFGVLGTVFVGLLASWIARDIGRRDMPHPPATAPDPSQQASDQDIAVQTISREGQRTWMFGLAALPVPILHRASVLATYDIYALWPDLIRVGVWIVVAFGIGLFAARFCPRWALAKTMAVAATLVVSTAGLELILHAFWPVAWDSWDEVTFDWPLRLLLVFPVHLGALLGARSVPRLHHDPQGPHPPHARR